MKTFISTLTVLLGLYVSRFSEVINLNCFIVEYNEVVSINAEGNWFRLENKESCPIDSILFRIYNKKGELIASYMANDEKSFPLMINSINDLKYSQIKSGTYYCKLLFWTKQSSDSCYFNTVFINEE